LIVCSRSHLLFGRKGLEGVLGPPLSVRWNNKCYVENVAHKIYSYGVRYLGLEWVYGDHLLTRLTVHLGQDRLAICIYMNDGSNLGTNRGERESETS
jgi:hypothetical protein